MQKYCKAINTSVEDHGNERLGIHIADCIYKAGICAIVISMHEWSILMLSILLSVEF